jgi:hypothetical protein
MASDVSAAFVAKALAFYNKSSEKAATAVQKVDYIKLIRLLTEDPFNIGEIDPLLDKLKDAEFDPLFKWGLFGDLRHLRKLRAESCGGTCKQYIEATIEYFDGSEVSVKQKLRKHPTFQKTNGGKLLGEGAYGKVLIVSDTAVVKQAVDDDICRNEMAILRLVSENTQFCVRKVGPYVKQDVPGKPTIVNIPLERYDIDLHHYIDVASTSISDPDQGTKYVETVSASILAGLVELNSLGILHRDLKPANVLINYDPHTYAVTRCVLADFGLSLRYELERPRQLVETRWFCTYNYLDPRVIRQYSPGSSSHDQSYLYDESCDVWSFGAILFEMLKCSRLFPLKDDEKHSSIQKRMGLLVTELKILLSNKLSGFNQSFWVIDCVRYILTTLPNTPVEMVGMSPMSPTAIYKKYQGPIRKVLGLDL